MNNLIDMLNNLKAIGVVGIKQSFEDEGVIYQDLIKMRRLTDICSLPLYVKIGGCEAKSDINNCVSLGVDCVIGPMIESPFAMSKFVGMTNKNINMMFVCETINAVNNLDSILSDNNIEPLSGMVFGRSDFVKSLNMSKSEVDSPVVCEKVRLALGIAKRHKLLTTLGGNLSTKSSNFISQIFREGLLNRVETRNVIIELNEDNVKSLSETIQKVLDFELSWLENKNEKYNAIMEDCVYRSELLRNRK
tara:strand:+ start:9046 stop:9789 length:744 start_codon:yes stop_codon:yes gene_type:complete